jgi:hypothetical protein
LHLVDRGNESRVAPAPTLRDEPVVRRAHLADGRTIDVRVVVPDDPYIDRVQLDTVVAELECEGEVLAVVTTPLDAADVDHALLLGERLRLGLEDGSLEPSADGIEAVASTMPA